MGQLTLSQDDFAQAIMADLANDVTLEMMRPGDMTKRDFAALVLRKSGTRISDCTAIRQMRHLSEMQPHKYQHLKVRGHTGQATWVLRVTLDDEQC
jgi:hypothetical protein